MDIPDKAWIAVGMILAAVIAGLISFVNILIAKDQKTTELRQAWIDALRQVTSDFTAHTITMVSLRNVTLPVVEQYHKEEGNRALAFSKLEEFFEEQSRPSLELRNRILLYLNPKEHVELICDIEELHRASYLDSKLNGDEAFAIAEKVLKETQVVLKNEWERVKRG
ncbi:MAG: hypothetical protein JRD05_02945, partial [Deltaproteobacteria bacterium]|nr:hypothetical protein [Deltaproteobacteria bacterium]